MTLEQEQFIKTMLDQAIQPLPHNRCKAVLEWNWHQHYPCILPEGHERKHRYETPEPKMKSEWRASK